MPNGAWGKIAFVNLSTGSIEVEQPPEEVYRCYLGGYGLGVYYLYQHIQPGADPLGPENIIGFLPGLLTGGGAPFAGRFMVVARSPLKREPGARPVVAGISDQRCAALATMVFSSAARRRGLGVTVISKAQGSCCAKKKYSSEPALSSKT